MRYDIIGLADRAGMSIKLVRHYLEKYGIGAADGGTLDCDSYTERHVKMLTIIKEINKSKYFSQPLATYYVEAARENRDCAALPKEGETVIGRVNTLLREIRELSAAA